MFAIVCLPNSVVRAAAFVLAFAAAYALGAAHAADAIAGSASYSLQPGMDATSYRLGTGDKVRVIVFGEDDLGGEFQIDSSGYVRLPLIGELQAQGLTVQALETRIETALGNGYLQQPRVNVEVTDYRPFYIIGEVNKPGQYPYVNDMSAPNAIALAGGYTEKAADSFLYVRRNGQTKEEEVPADETTKIGPGDVVRVPPTMFWAAITFAGPISAIVSTRWYLPTPP
jgi:polysaccharide export outer membrane protein